MISRRRLSWGLIAILAVAATLTVRPLRSWIDLAFVRLCVDSRLSVKSVDLHWNESVIQSENVRWVADARNRRLTIDADSVWMAIEPEPLLDRQFHFPQVTVENARLTLSRVPTIAQSNPPDWRQILARELSNLDWEAIREHVGSLLTAKNINESWSQRIDKWVADSRKIASRIDSLDWAVDRTNNPLRDEDTIRAQLQSMENLDQEQTKLLEQLSNLTRLLDIERKRLAENFQEELDSLRPPTSGNSADSYERLATQLVIQQAKIKWMQLVSKVELAELLGPETLAPGSKELAGRTIDHSASNQFLDLGLLTISGTLTVGNDTCNFDAHGSLSGERVNSCPDSTQGRWRILLHELENPICICTQWQDYPTMQVQMSLTEMPVDYDLQAIKELGLDAQAAMELPDFPLPRLAGELRPDGLTATMRLSPTEIVASLDIDAPILRNSMREADSLDEMFVVQIDGDWSAPEFGLLAPLPPALMASVRAQLDQQRHAQLQDIKSQLQFEFDLELSRLESLAKIANQRQSMIAQEYNDQLRQVIAEFDSHPESVPAFAKRSVQALYR